MPFIVQPLVNAVAQSTVIADVVAE